MGVNMLSKKDTFDKLLPSNLFLTEGEAVTIKPAKIWGKAAPDFEKELTVNSDRIGVFTISGERAKVFNYGGIQIGKDLLNLDFGSAEFIKTILKKDKRAIIRTTYCIPLWSHHWGSGYYDYMFFIYTKLLRIKAVIDPEIFRDIKIAYPLFNTPFERDLWKLAGLEETQIIDTAKYNVKADHYFLTNTHSWYYQHKHDIKLLQQILTGAHIETEKASPYIYISRKGRRKLINEEEIILILKQFNFTIIEDKPRSVSEQMSIFNNSQIIIGPHGAAFTNILWCKPQTLLIELFPRGYHPPYFRYMAQILNLQYAAIFESDIQDTHFSNLDENLTIDPQLLKTALTALFFNKTIEATPLTVK